MYVGSILDKACRALLLHLKSFFPGTKKTVGEYFNPGLNCSDILDKLDDAKDGFYWITLKRSNPVKVGNLLPLISLVFRQKYYC